MRVPDILTQGAITYKRKNEDYGDSWRKVGDILAILAKDRPIVLRTPQDILRFALFVRRFDKLARAFEGEFFAKDPNYESLGDSHKDESVYAAMHAATYYDRPSKGRFWKRLL